MVSFSLLIMLAIALAPNPGWYRIGLLPQSPALLLDLLLQGR